MEEELLPELRKQLEEEPGAHHLQRQIMATEHKIAQYKQLKYLPRPTPLIPEKGYFDRVMEMISGGETSVGALSGSTEEDQFDRKKKKEIYVPFGHWPNFLQCIDLIFMKS